MPPEAICSNFLTFLDKQVLQVALFGFVYFLCVLFAVRISDAKHGTVLRNMIGMSFNLNCLRKRCQFLILHKKRFHFNKIKKM